MVFADTESSARNFYARITDVYEFLLIAILGGAIT